MASSVSSSTSGSSLAAGGLASGMDTTSIINSLVAAESQPITLLQNQQAALKTQLSSVGAIVSKLQALGTATQALQTDGVLAVSTSSTNTSFSAVAGSAAAAGRYAVQIQSLARAAQARSGAFSSAFAPVAGGTLNLTVQGTAYSVTIGDGTSLTELAAQIRASGAPVTATVLSDGTSSYLSLSARDTGYPIGGQVSDALSVAFTPITGATGQNPAFAVTQTAQNAVVNVNGLPLTRQSNTVADAIPGVTLTLKSQGAQEDLVLATDVDGTKTKLQQFVGAYNDLIKLVQAQLSPAPDTDRSRSLTGDQSVRDLQMRLQRLTSTTVEGLGTVRSLADLGIKTARDGTLSVDDTTLAAAITRDPQAVNALFQTESAGLGAVVQGLVEHETRSTTGALSLDQDRINHTISRLDDQIAAAQDRIAKYRQTLVAQFTAMETTISSLKSISAFLTSQDQKSSGG